MIEKEEFREKFLELIHNKENPFHPLVWISGDPVIGENTYIGGFSEVYAKGAGVAIGSNCDIASFVVINCADSHLKAIGLSDEVEKKDITIEDHVFVGTHTAILGGCHIGHHSVVGAGCVLKNKDIPPYSLVYRDDETGALIVKEEYFKDKLT